MLCCSVPEGMKNGNVEQGKKGKGKEKGSVLKKLFSEYLFSTDRKKKNQKKKKKQNRILQKE